MIAIAKLIAAVKIAVAASMLLAVVGQPASVAATVNVEPLSSSVAPYYVAPTEDSAGWNCNEQGNRKCYAGARVQAQA